MTAFSGGNGSRVQRLLLPGAILLLGGLLSGCGGGGGGEANEATDTLTRRQKDSLVSQMPIPGAGAVGKALDAADAAKARAERHDSLIK